MLQGPNGDNSNREMGAFVGGSFLAMVLCTAALFTYPAAAWFVLPLCFTLPYSFLLRKFQQDAEPLTGILKFRLLLPVLRSFLLGCVITFTAYEPISKGYPQLYLVPALLIVLLEIVRWVQRFKSKD